MKTTEIGMNWLLRKLLYKNSVVYVQGEKRVFKEIRFGFIEDHGGVDVWIAAFSVFIAFLTFIAALYLFDVIYLGGFGD